MDWATQKQNLIEDAVVAALVQGEDYGIILYGDVMLDMVEVNGLRCLVHRAFERLLPGHSIGERDSVPLMHGATCYAPLYVKAGEEE